MKQIYLKTFQDNTSRIIDANANRSREGLRVVEDISRFVLNNNKLTFEIKKIRHKLTSLFKKLKVNFISARDSVKDVGIITKLSTEIKRSGFIDLVKANTQRVKEALRVLEEVSKVLNNKTSNEFKLLRFRIYTIEQDILSELKPKIDLSLYVIIDKEFLSCKSRRENKTIQKVVNEVCKGGVTVVQYRDKTGNTKEIIKICKVIRGITRKHNVGFIVNDRVDIALVVGADGVHLGNEDMEIKQARQILGDRIIGATAHSVKEARFAEKNGADYLGVGPIFKTKTKKVLPSPKGIGFMKQIKKNIGIPLVAIGGINIDNARKVSMAGVDGIAVVSAVLNSKNILSTCKRLYNLVRRKK